MCLWPYSQMLNNNTLTVNDLFPGVYAVETPGGPMMLTALNKGLSSSLVNSY